MQYSLTLNLYFFNLSSINFPKEYFLLCSDIILRDPFKKNFFICYELNGVMSHITFAFKCKWLYIFCHLVQ